MSTSSKKDRLKKLEDILFFDLKYFKEIVTEYIEKLNNVNSLDIIEIFELIAKLNQNNASSNSFACLLSNRLYTTIKYFPISNTNIYHKSFISDPTVPLDEIEVLKYKNILSEYIKYAEKYINDITLLCDNVSNLCSDELKNYISIYIYKNKLENYRNIEGLDLSTLETKEFFLYYFISTLYNCILIQGFDIRKCSYCDKILVTNKVTQEFHSSCSNKGRQKKYRELSFITLFTEQMDKSTANSSSLILFEDIDNSIDKLQQLINSKDYYSYYVECIKIYTLRFKNGTITQTELENKIDNLVQKII